MTGKTNKFNWRGWTTFLVTVSFIVDTLSGIILYIAPPGRIANWTNWRVWGLSKDEWTAIHTIFGYVLLIIIGIHLYFNWKIFWSFIWNRIKKALNLKKELITALLVCLIIFMGTLWEIPPFSSTMNLGEYLKESWDEAKADTPIAHGELMSLEEFAETTQISLETILKALDSKGYKITGTKQILAEIAEENNISPSELYEAMKSGGAESKAPQILEGSGFGQKTLSQVCDEYGIPLDMALANLEKTGAKAEQDTKIKDIASSIGKTPVEMIEIIKGGK
ncbi:MAG: DUF4405 domain-containing protein [Deltaproteobacteria bacterium]|nr:DUF4405 domain-containing protein [Deltaproteobacteria bacterium]